MTDDGVTPRVREPLDWAWIFERLSAWTTTDQSAVQVHCVLRRARDQDWRELYDWVVAEGRKYVPQPAPAAPPSDPLLPPAPPAVPAEAEVARRPKPPSIGPIKSKVERAVERIGHRLGEWEAEYESGYVAAQTSRCTRCGAIVRILMADGQIIAIPLARCVPTETPSAATSEGGQMSLFD